MMMLKKTRRIFPTEYSGLPVDGSILCVSVQPYQKPRAYAAFITSHKKPTIVPLMIPLRIPYRLASSNLDSYLLLEKESLH